MPKADRDWKAYYASRPEDRKKVDRKTRSFRPLNDEVIRQHLAGEHTVGAYRLLLDETCCFLAVDFDKKTWQEDSAAFLGVCQELNVPAALERSRPGNGGHVWIFFDRAVPAVTARKLGCVILTRTMEHQHQETSELVLATGSYIGEGFDDARLDTLFLQCRSPGRELFSNMLVGCIVCTTISMSSRSMTTLIRTFLCWPECMSVG
jgi:hypothetical protein